MFLNRREATLGHLMLPCKTAAWKREQANNPSAGVRIKNIIFRRPEHERIADHTSKLSLEPESGPESLGVAKGVSV